MHTSQLRWIEGLLIAVAASVWVGAAQSQELGTGPRFEVVSVRQNRAETAESKIDHGLAGRFVATDVPVFFLILDAYEIKAYQLAGAPEWTSDKLYDVAGTFVMGSSPDLHAVHLMERQVLADRFGLKLHAVQREVPAYELVLARKDGHLGPQMSKTSMDCAAWMANGRPQVSGVTKSPVSSSGVRPLCELITTRTWLSGGARTIGDLSGSLEAMLGRPVLDRTGLTGPYDMDLQWARTDLQAGNEAADAPSLLSAVEEQLGLRLVAHREWVGELVVDSIHAPTAN